MVCSGRTGHTEAVELFYNPEEVSFNGLCDTFFAKIDPTQKNGQGFDRGSQYRTGMALCLFGSVVLLRGNAFVLGGLPH